MCCSRLPIMRDQVGKNGEIRDGFGEWSRSLSSAEPEVVQCFHHNRACPRPHVGPRRPPFRVPGALASDEYSELGDALWIARARRGPSPASAAANTVACSRLRLTSRARTSCRGVLALDPPLRLARIGADDVDVQGMQRPPELGHPVAAYVSFALARDPRADGLDHPGPMVGVFLSLAGPTVRIRLPSVR
jgi:hypothetical protein